MSIDGQNSHGFPVMIFPQSKQQKRPGSHYHRGRIEEGPGGASVERWGDVFFFLLNPP